MSFSAKLNKAIGIKKALGHPLKQSDFPALKMFHAKWMLITCRRCDGTLTEPDSANTCCQCSGKGTEKVSPKVWRHMNQPVQVA